VGHPPANANEWGTQDCVGHPPWSSFRSYAYQEQGLVRVNFQEWALKIKPVSRQRFGEAASVQTPLIRSERE